MTSTDEYNGWANWETWACALHLSNDEGLYNWATEVVENALAERAEWLADQDLEPDNDGAHWAGDDLRDAFENDLIGSMEPDFERMMLDDIGSRWRIDWTAVARSFMPE